MEVSAVVEVGMEGVAVVIGGVGFGIAEGAALGGGRPN